MEVVMPPCSVIASKPATAAATTVAGQTLAPGGVSPSAHRYLTAQRNISGLGMVACGRARVGLLSTRKAADASIPSAGVATGAALAGVTSTKVLDELDAPPEDGVDSSA